MNLICYNKLCMKRVILILTLFLMILNPVLAANSVKKELTVQSVDGFSIKATFEYPKVKGKKEFSTVVLLHSLGYSSEWWETLPNELIESGYAVLQIDLRGHGKSVYNSKLERMSWKSMTNTAYAKYPEDVAKVIEYVKSENSKKVFFKDWAIVGADIGGSTAILSADLISYKPKTIVILSPVVNTRGLYVPVKLANLTNIDIFCILGTDDFESKEAAEYLKKFAQAAFVTYTSESKSMGMIMLKNDVSLAKIITGWLKEYL